MLTEGQRVFKVTINNGIVEGSLFKVEEFIISEITSPPYRSVLLVDSEGNLADTTSYTSFDRSISNDSRLFNIFFNHGMKAYISNILKLDELLADLLKLVRENTSDILNSLKKEIALLDTDFNQYLVDKGYNFSSMLEEKEYFMNAVMSESLNPNFAVKMSFSLNERNLFQSSILIGTYSVNNQIDIEDLISSSGGDIEVSEYYQKYLEDTSIQSVNFHQFEKEDGHIELVEWSEFCTDKSLTGLRKNKFCPFLFSFTKVIPIDINDTVLIKDTALYWVKDQLGSLFQEYYSTYVDYADFLSNRNHNQLVEQYFID